MYAHVNRQLLHRPLLPGTTADVSVSQVTLEQLKRLVTGPKYFLEMKYDISGKHSSREMLTLNQAVEGIRGVSALYGQGLEQERVWQKKLATIEAMFSSGWNVYAGKSPEKIVAILISDRDINLQKDSTVSAVIPEEDDRALMVIDDWFKVISCT